jgi:ribosomal protein L7/L12
MSVEVYAVRKLLAKARPDLAKVIDRTRTLRELMLVVEVAPQNPSPALVSGNISIQPCSAPSVDYQVDVWLTRTGQDKIGTIKLVRNIANLGLKEAKELVDKTCDWTYDGRGTVSQVPVSQVVALGVDRKRAKTIIDSLAMTGAQAETRPVA